MSRYRHLPALAAAFLLLVAGFFSYGIVRDALVDEASRPLPANGLETVLARRCVSIVVLMSIGVWMGAIATSPVFVMSYRAGSRPRAGLKFEDALARLSEDTDPGHPWGASGGTAAKPAPRAPRRVLRARRSASVRKPPAAPRGGLGFPRKPDEGISPGPDNPFRI